jgi:leucyl aminopeptidase (aminopeptidase T)
MQVLSDGNLYKRLQIIARAPEELALVERTRSSCARDAEHKAAALARAPERQSDEVTEHELAAMRKEVRMSAVTLFFLSCHCMPLYA